MSLVGMICSYISTYLPSIASLCQVRVSTPAHISCTRIGYPYHTSPHTITITRMTSGVPHRVHLGLQLFMYLEDMVLELMKNDMDTHK